MTGGARRFYYLGRTGNVYKIGEYEGTVQLKNETEGDKVNR